MARSRIISPRELVLDVYRAAVAAALPEPAVAAALDRKPLGQGPVRIIAIGKAAPGMARAASGWLNRHGRALAGGIIVGSEAAELPGLQGMAGDHPTPGPRSLTAAEALRGAARPATGESVVVMISGGTSSLVAAPVEPVTPDALAQLFRVLGRAGLDIGTMNAIRKRFLRWGAGRLARALYPAPVRVLVLSDVIGDDPATVGSGPMSPDPLTAAEVRALLAQRGLLDAVAPPILDYLDAAAAGIVPETPAPGDEAFRAVEIDLIGSNRLALAAAAGRAEALGWRTECSYETLSGEAAAAGERIGRELRTIRSTERWCRLWGGETTVALDTRSGTGGRSQEFALSAARALQGIPSVALLAAGTDGRDGPTDAAGALVDGSTWDRIARAGVAPEKALRRHDSYHALDAAGALVRTGPTGTNVMDLVIAAGQP